MTLNEYLKENSPNRICVLMFDKGGKMLEPMEYEKKDYKSMSKELKNREVMDVNEEEDLIEMWVM